MFGAHLPPTDLVALWTRVGLMLRWAGMSIAHKPCPSVVSEKEWGASVPPYLTLLRDDAG